LGSIDLLRGSATLDWSLVEQIQKCSLNLVDVIDHLLDFAQINNKATLRRTTDHRHEIAAGKLPIRNLSSSCVSLSSTTEAIVDSVFYSHYFTKHDRTQPHVDLVMDLSPESDISCMISVGAWKRLCTNIVNNALKYTPSGHVKVSLDVSARGTGEKRAVLTVSDTGIGMSPEFLQERLFKSFAQENTFATGTGLGMSLVAELIKEFGGEIEVTSKKGHGTTMTVTIPLEIPQDVTTEALGSETNLSDLSVFYFEPDEIEGDAARNRQALTDAAKRTLRNVGVTVSSSSDTRIVAVLEEHFKQSPSDMQTGEHRWLVLCDSFASATRLRERFQSSNVDFVPQPYGPVRFSSALQTLHKSLSENTESSTVPTSLPPAANDSDSSSSFKYRRNRSMSALPAALDASLEHLTLSSPRTNTVKATAQNRPSHVDEQFTQHATDASGGDAVAGGQDMLTPLPYKESSPLADPLLLLLVDDNVSAVTLNSQTSLTSLQPINLKLLSMVADRNHYPRLLATNGQEAVDAYISPKEASQPTKLGNKALSHIPNRRPDVVLLDLNMPIMNGFEAARQIRQFEKQTGATPAVIIAITGLGDDIARAKAYQHGFNFFMSKPVRPKDVTDMLESIIQTKCRDGQKEFGFVG
jgi:CheY-like chemotaxis protein